MDLANSKYIIDCYTNYCWHSLDGVGRISLDSEKATKHSKF